MRKNRFFITEEEGKTIETALKFILLKTETNKDTPLERVEYLVKVSKLLQKLIQYKWEVE